MVFRRPVFATLTVPATGISCGRENIEGDSILKWKNQPTGAYCGGLSMRILILAGFPGFGALKSEGYRRDEQGEKPSCLIANPLRAGDRSFLPSPWVKKTRNEIHGNGQDNRLVIFGGHLN